MFENLETPRKLGTILRSIPAMGAVKSALVASLLLGLGSAEAKVIFVNGAVSNGGNGSTWQSAYKYLRDALDRSAASDVIYLAKGTYYPDEGASAEFGDRSNSFELKGQKIYGGFSGTETRLDQRNPQANFTELSGAIWDQPGEDVYWSLHVVTIKRSSVLDGLTVANGHANGATNWNYPTISIYDQGGGCYVQAGATLTLSTCIFRDNRALQYGGAIAVENSTGKVVATNCVFNNNFIGDYILTPGVAEGGAIKGNVEAENCTFSSNFTQTVNAIKESVSSGFGGAISGDVKATRCVFTKNSAIALARIRFDSPDVNPLASGGAIYGNVVASNCTFTGNEAFASKGVPKPLDPDLPIPPPPVTPEKVVLVGEGVSSGGAIAGGSVVAMNCAFSNNKGASGKIEEDETALGGGGAVSVASGESQLVNCVFVNNTSDIQGGAVYSGTTADKDSLIVSNCTFLDNGVPLGFSGAALSCGGIVRMLNNIYWFKDIVSGAYIRDNLVFVRYKGVLRNSLVNYPDPTSVAPNIVKNGPLGIIRGNAADLYLGPQAVTIISGDPLFKNMADPDGPDDLYGTADDGLGLSLGSPAIGSKRDPRLIDTDNFLLTDSADMDNDENRSERIPLDIAKFARVQNSLVDMGAYEFGIELNVPDIAVLVSKGQELFDGNSNSMGSVKMGSNRKRVFIVKNVGRNALMNLSFSLKGSKTFSISKSSTKSLDQGESTKVTVIFKPTRKGKQVATLKITSNDADENPFDIKLNGMGVVRSKKARLINLGAVVMSTSNSTSRISAGMAGAAVTTSEPTDGLKYQVLTLQKSALASDSDPIVEVSSNLLDWSSGPDHTTTLVDNLSILSVRDNTVLSPGEKRYIRVR